ncbi:hypothetical protein [Kribbella sp. CA-294648]|uniref:hypothetical protein n=1 Tax=Kribbella sp. CA-294648 TaxID=3239948 RepID=UPI003D8C8145
MRLELGLAEPLSTGGRTVLLRAVLAGVVERARREALASKEQYTHEESGREYAFRIAAAGELLRVPDPENTFETMQDYRSRTKTLPDNTTGSARQRAKLRAALWLGATATKTAERLEEKVPPLLAAAMASYAREQRSRLRSLLDEDLPTDEESDVDPPVLNEDEPAESASRYRWYLRAGIALAIVAGLIWGGIALLDNDDPSKPGAGSTPESSTPTASSSTPPLAGQGIVDQVKACASLPRDSQAARDLRSNRQVVVDGRCYPDPTVDVGTQAAPTRESADVSLVSTGQVLNNVCLRSGQETSDMVGTRTKVWVRFDVDADRQAFISAIWTQGDEGADPC